MTVVVRPYYDDGRVTIYHGDCREILPTLEPASVDLLLTDPPYDRNYKSGWNTHKVMAGDDGTLDIADAINAALRLVKHVRHFYVFGSLDISSLTTGATCELIWDKGRPGMGNLDIPWGVGHERIAFGVWSRFASDRGKGAQIARRRRGTVLRHSTTNRWGAKVHPTRKPPLLLRELIEASSTFGDVVLDPFMGSGSTLEAAALEGRRAIGVEIEERYCEIAARRIDQGIFDLGEAA
jgi:DNA modification methylase